MRIERLLVIIFLILSFYSCSFAASNQLNIYVWYNEIPPALISKFEKETGIHVNYADYNDNEILYAKLKADPNSGYDIVEPSSYFVSRMSREGMLQTLDKQKLPGFSNIYANFKNPSYDPQDNYSIPWMWGMTGIFVNNQFHDPKAITSWTDLWNKKYYNQLMLLDDPREVFSMSLIELGLSPNTSNPKDIKAAYKNLLKLMPNVKLFNSDAIPSIFIDADVSIGMAWNGDVYRAQQENHNLEFIFPKDGFIIWVDCMAIPKNAPHLANAYKFLNFLLQPENASVVTQYFGYPTANAKAKNYLPKNIQNNPIIFPSEEILQRGIFQTDIDNKALQIYAKYWELLKLNA